MSFSSPWWLLLLLLVPLVILLHALTLRWRSVPASSLLFWNEVIKERAASLRARRLLSSLVLLLQLLAVAALALALGGPLLFLPGRGGSQDVILVVDATASMQAREGARTRWEIARERGLSLAAGLRGGARMAVVLAEKAPRLLSPFTADRAALRRLLLSARATDEPGDVADSMLFAMSLRDPRRDGRVVLETDGAFEALRGVDLSLPWVTVDIVGSARDNVGITQMSLRPGSGAGAGTELFLAVMNAGREPAAVPLIVRAAGREVVSRTLDVDAGRTAAVSIPWTGPQTGRVEALLGRRDALPLDDAAYAELSPAGRLQVLVVGPRPYFVQQAFEALPGVTVRTEEAPPLPGFPTDNHQADGGRADGPRADVVVYVGAQPPPLPRGNFILLDAVPPNLPVRARGILRAPAVTGWSRNDPLLESASLAGIRIAQALDLDPGPGFSVIAASGASPLLLRWDHSGVKALLLAFDPRVSDFPLRPGFPILLANALSWFFPGWLQAQVDQVQAGDPRVIPAEGAGSVTVLKPHGRQDTLAAGGPSVTFHDTDETGFYAVEAGGVHGEFAVNLASESETDISPRFTAPSAPPQAGGQRAGAPRPVWPAVAGAALLLLLLEWLAWLWRPGRSPAA